MQDNNTALDGDRVGLYPFVFNFSASTPVFHGDVISFYASSVRVHDRAAIRNIELPTMPRAAQDLALSSLGIFPWRGR